MQAFSATDGSTDLISFSMHELCLSARIRPLDKIVNVTLGDLMLDDCLRRSKFPELVGACACAVVHGETRTHDRVCRNVAGRSNF